MVAAAPRKQVPVSEPLPLPPPTVIITTDTVKGWSLGDNPGWSAGSAACQLCSLPSLYLSFLFHDMDSRTPKCESWGCSTKLLIPLHLSPPVLPTGQPVPGQVLFTCWSHHPECSSRVSTPPKIFPGDLTQHPMPRAGVGEVESSVGKRGTWFWGGCSPLSE